MTFPVKLKQSCFVLPQFLWSLYVLFDFRTNLALHFARSPSSHSYGYDFSGDRPNCLARFALNLESFMRYPG